jgi:sugar phosphate isomerase/epimerase
MKISFSTLACPTWTLDAAIDAADRLGFDGIELRFIENDDLLWRRPEFSGAGLQATRNRLASAGLAISCVDTSCFFHYPEADRRKESCETGHAMIDLAAELCAPAIRVFGDRVQKGADRTATEGWIVENIATLADFGLKAGVQVWLETHGDFARAGDTLELLQRAGQPNTGAIWDPLNAYCEFAEEPQAGLSVLGTAARHVHIKDARRPHSAQDDSWEPVLMGAGEFPALDLIRLLNTSGYDRFVSFEWEKRWHPQIPEPEIALPHFMNWIKRAALEA